MGSQSIPGVLQPGLLPNAQQLPPVVAAQQDAQGVVVAGLLPNGLTPQGATTLPTNGGMQPPPVADVVAVLPNGGALQPSAIVAEGTPADPTPASGAESDSTEPVGPVFSIIPPKIRETQPVGGSSIVDQLIQQKEAYEKLMQEHIAQMKLRHQQEQLALAAYHQQMAVQRASLALQTAALPAVALGATPTLPTAMSQAAAANGGVPLILNPENVPGVTDVRFQGRIKMINAEKSYGFIGNPPELAEKFTKKDVFVQRSDAATYQVGDLVAFGIRLHTDGRPQAKDMELITSAAALASASTPVMMTSSSPAMVLSATALTAPSAVPLVTSP